MHARVCVCVWRGGGWGVGGDDPLDTGRSFGFSDSFRSTAVNHRDKPVGRMEMNERGA
jgi:hypothetical protein